MYYKACHFCECVESLIISIMILAIRWNQVPQPLEITKRLCDVIQQYLTGLVTSKFRSVPSRNIRPLVKLRTTLDFLSNTFQCRLITQLMSTLWKRLAMKWEVEITILNVFVCEHSFKLQMTIITVAWWLAHLVMRMAMIIKQLRELWTVIFAGIETYRTCQLAIPTLLDNLYRR